MRGAAPAFAERVIAWQRSRGRSGLPWQDTRDPYRIWLSEVMLQQTQVSVVIPYYQRFLERFPDVAALARASEEDVLTLWSGLGYYSRGRNLHRAAQRVVEEFKAFPRERQALESLPGVGRSTAAAIAAFSGGAREAILDGNVRRVLARCFAVAGYPGDAKVEKRLWALAESLLPAGGIERYTQGMMDLGATLCTRTKPRCGECPLEAQCEARRQDAVDAYPAPRPRKALPRRTTVMLSAVSGRRILLVKRPAPGLWGGLWCLPEFASTRDALAATGLGFQASTHKTLALLEHQFTHFSLVITPVLCIGRASTSKAAPTHSWMQLEDAQNAALPSPVRRLIARVAEEIDG